MEQRRVACLDDGWGESEAQGSVSLHFCLTGWRRI
ncbi:hypothetical protein E2C01_089238 [Portunus trituberculatus]|uniref:Uncharacterized protein n=1 Tax=Portunus trituberculatus TaxID=210409 RepID=A0A5B7JIJ9_PORTR|nr:hypothetical protein [Portunus trituberculatus]